jgi:hypothetical protein
VTGPADVHVFGRVDASAIGDGGAVDVEISDPSTFSTLEAYVGAWRHVWGPVGAAAVVGGAVPLEGGEIVALERYPKTFGVGVIAGHHASGAWAIAMLGRHEAAGDGLKLIFSGEIPIDGRVSSVADGAIGGQGSFVRLGAAVRLK